MTTVDFMRGRLFRAGGHTQTLIRSSALLNIQSRKHFVAQPTNARYNKFVLFADRQTDNIATVAILLFALGLHVCESRGLDNNFAHLCCRDVGRTAHFRCRGCLSGAGATRPSARRCSSRTWLGSRLVVGFTYRRSLGR